MSENISEFIEEILKIDEPDAKTWIKDFEAGFPASLWLAFLKRPITEEAVECLVIGISFQISRQIRQMSREDIGRKLMEGRCFLEAVCRKAGKYDIYIDPEIYKIAAPGLEPVCHILAKAGFRA